MEIAGEVDTAPYDTKNLRGKFRGGRGRGMSRRHAIPAGKSENNGRVAGPTTPTTHTQPMATAGLRTFAWLKKKVHK